MAVPSTCPKCGFYAPTPMASTAPSSSAGTYVSVHDIYTCPGMGCGTIWMDSFGARTILGPAVSSVVGPPGPMGPPGPAYMPAKDAAYIEDQLASDLDDLVACVELRLLDTIVSGLEDLIARHKYSTELFEAGEYVRSLRLARKQ